MESPLNEKIQRELKRKAAKKKNDGNYVPVLTLRDKVLSLVTESNKNVPVGRRVTPRTALTVMNRALNELSSLEYESLEYGVLREVSRFISLSASTIRHNDNEARHLDLLSVGHPLSELNVSLSDDQHRVAYANWLASDPKIDDSARVLVATAYSALPDSVEREHAFMRLRTLTAGAVPNYVKIEHFPITAAFGSGNSSAARRARVALQWRDKKGRWVEMGRGGNFKYSMPNGSSALASGIYVGVSPDGQNGLFQVTGDKNLADGIYSVPAQNVEIFSARIPESALAKAGIKKKAVRNEALLPSLESIKNSRLDAPTGWTKVEDPSRIDTYTSDDNYTAKVKVFPVGNRQTEYVLYRQNEDGSLGEKVGDATNWAEINDLANGDNEAYDKIKGDVVARIVSPEREQERRESNARLDELEKIADSGNDERGNQLPAGWDAVIRPGVAEARQQRRLGNDQILQNESPPTLVYEKVAAEVPGRPDKPYVITARMMEDGRLLSEGIWDSWEALDAGIPERVNAEGLRIQAQLEPISYDGTDVKATLPDAQEPAVPSVDEILAKVPSSVEPSTPDLFTDFKVPDGAFQLRTAMYEPDGRVDEASSNFTDDPKQLSTMFTQQDLVQALTQALLGNSSDAAVAEILNANVDDNSDIIDAADIPEVVIPQVNVGRPSGAGQLEFSAGAEFVPAESLYNALWESGMDPNRVIATIYDSANGNNNNLNKLIEAQGGVPSQEEAELVDDIVQEIRQLKEVSEPGDSPVANEKQTPSPDPLPGALIENIPIDFENPDYYIPNPEAYIPSQPEVDENGYTDNPEIVSTDYEVADLIEQMLSGITDGSGSALLAFDNITVEVPVEAIRDAIQYQGINTNQILLDLKKESNDMSEEEEAPVRVGPPTTGQRQASERPRLQAHSQMIKDLIEQTGGTVDDETADKIRDAIDQENMLDWSEAEDEDIIEAIAEVAGPEILEQAAAEAETPADSADTPRDPSVDEPMPNALTTPVLVYPGPENPGYRPDNTTLDVSGKVMGYGSRIRASRDGATGTVIAVQNIDSRSGDRIPYVRVLFDDGRIAVRSALKVRVTDENAQRVAPVDQVPERPRPLPDVSSRLDAENPSTGAIATDGSIRGVNSLGVLPEALADLANPNARQTDFAQWGERAGEIARAGRERVTLENIRQAAYDLEVLKLEVREAANGPERDQKQEEYTIAAERFDFMVTDAFGMREGVTFGRNEYSIEQGGTRAYVSGSIEEIRGGKKGISLDQAFSIRDKNGSTVGTGGRTITLKFNPDGTSYWSVKNNSLSIPQAKDKKSGFATAYNRFMEDWYIANGVREIHVYAAGGERWQGGFVWALNGFNWDGPERAESQLTYSLNRLRRMASSDVERSNIDYLLKKFNDAKTGGTVDLNKVPTPLEIAHVGWYPGAKEWIGKKHMINTTWEGVKRLDPKAKEQIQALNYDQMRAARKRLEAKENKAGVSREFSLTVNSNEFQNNNVELQPFLEDIRDVFTNNRSMAVLAPAAKAALNRFISTELLKKKEDRQVPFNDILQLRRVLDAEYAADHPNALPKDFGVGKDLISATLTQIETNNIPGFTVRELGLYESGYNTSYLVTHNDSGQVFYLKEDRYSDEYNINPVRAEVEAGVLARGLGLRGGYETRGNDNNEKIVIMQQAGAAIGLYGNPQNAYQVFSDGAIISSDDTLLRFDTREEFVDHLASPEDAIRIVLLDLLIDNTDRHNGNVLIAVDASDSRKLRLLPIDHSVAGLGRNTETNFNFEDVLDPGGNDNIYNRTMPVLTKRMSQDELLAIFRNQADRLRGELKNESLLPTGAELALIEKEWGSIDNYREVINSRLDMLLAPNGEMLPDMMDILKPGYWT